VLDEAPPHLVDDLDRNVTGPALAGVESDDTDGVVFASEQLADQRFPTGVVVVGLAPGPAEAAEIARAT